MHQIGKAGEKLVAKWLKTQNWQILQQQWRCRFGEIDIIALNQAFNILAFVEVKTRGQNNWDQVGLLAVNQNKQAKIIQTAQLFLGKYPKLANYICRFDVALVSYQAISLTSEILANYPAEKFLLDSGNCFYLFDYLPSAFELE